MGDSFLWGVKNGELEEVRKQVEAQGVDILNSDIGNGRQALHYAADYGHSVVIEYLISKGADVNVADKHGITPLLAAIWEGHTNCVQLLLEKGAKRNGTAPDGTSYLENAEKEEIKVLLK